MNYSRLMSAAVSPTQVQSLTVEFAILPGFPAMEFSGLPDQAIKEAQKRIRSAVLQLGSGLAEKTGERLRFALGAKFARRFGAG